MATVNKELHPYTVEALRGFQALLTSDAAPGGLFETLSPGNVIETLAAYALAKAAILDLDDELPDDTSSYKGPRYEDDLAARVVRLNTDGSIHFEIVEDAQELAPLAHLMGVALPEVSAES